MVHVPGYMSYATRWYTSWKLLKPKYHEISEYIGELQSQEWPKWPCMKFTPRISCFVIILRDDIIIKVDKSNHSVWSISNTPCTSNTIFDLITANILDFWGSIIGQIQILTSEMDSLTPKMVYTMYHTMVLLEKCQNQNFTFSPGVPIYDDLKMT